MHCPNIRVTSPTLLSVSYIKTIRVLLTKISVFFVAVCLSCFDFGKGGGVVVCLVFVFVFCFLVKEGGDGCLFILFYFVLVFFGKGGGVVGCVSRFALFFFVFF
jgi:hypothetical protein